MDFCQDGYRTHGSDAKTLDDEVGFHDENESQELLRKKTDLPAYASRATTKRNFVCLTITTCFLVIVCENILLAWLLLKWKIPYLSSSTP